jgi:hypothetical protein
MSDTDLLGRYTDRIAEGRSVLDRGEGSACDDLGCFGWLRGIRDRATMLELRRKDGNILAVGYGWLERALFNPSDGITLHVAGQIIRIRGRSLNAEVRQAVRLFEGLTRHRVPWIREASRAENLAAEDGACWIESIEW